MDDDNGYLDEPEDWAGRCEDCWYWSDRYTSVCTNDKSDRYGGFVNYDSFCPMYRRTITKGMMLDDEEEDETEGEEDE